MSFNELFEKEPEQPKEAKGFSWCDSQKAQKRPNGSTSKDFLATSL